MVTRRKENDVGKIIVGKIIVGKIEAIKGSDVVRVIGGVLEHEVEPAPAPSWVREDDTARRLSHDPRLCGEPFEVVLHALRMMQVRGLITYMVDPEHAFRSLDGAAALAPDFADEVAAFIASNAIGGRPE